MTALTNTAKRDRSMNIEEVTLRDGYWFVFEDGEEEIAANGSVWNGKEWVYFNDQLVSEKRNATSRTTEHEFTIGKDRYKLVFYMKSLMKAELECTLYKNDKQIGHDIRKPVKSGNFKKTIFKCFIAGAIAGVLGAALGEYLAKTF